MEKLMDPFVSVIVPTYNRDGFILECLDSIFKQSYNNFECIVIDDGSTDNTRDVIENAGFPVKYFFQDNKGPSSARNLGIKHSKGKLIAFLDSDDYWLQEKLMTQVEFFNENHDCSINYTEEIWYRKGKRVNPCKHHKKYSGWIFEKLLPLCIISPSSVLIKKEVFEDVGFFDEQLLACEDYDLWLRIGCKYPIFLIDKPLIVKRNGHDDHQSQKFYGLDRFRIQALQKMIALDELKDEQKVPTQDMLIKKCKIFIEGCIKRGKTNEVQRYKKIITDINSKLNSA